MRTSWHTAECFRAFRVAHLCILLCEHFYDQSLIGDHHLLFVFWRNRFHTHWHPSSLSNLTHRVECRVLFLEMEFMLGDDNCLASFCCVNVVLYRPTKSLSLPTKKLSIKLVVLMIDTCFTYSLISASSSMIASAPISSYLSVMDPVVQSPRRLSS